MNRPDPWEPGEFNAYELKKAREALGEAARMMQAIKRTWGPESTDDGADGELWGWLNDFVARYGASSSTVSGAVELSSSLASPDEGGKT
jgi:hypothetical protein